MSQTTGPVLIGIDINKLCKTTGWHNNCGLNCLTHFLVGKMQSKELQNRMEMDDEYAALLSTFQEYYQLPVKPTWNDIAHLMEAFSVPTDQEAILAPVLRKHLAKVMMQDPVLLWQTDGASAFSDYLHTGEVHDVAEPIVRRNKPYLNALKTKFDRNLRHVASLAPTALETEEAITKLQNRKPPIEATQENINKQIQFQRRNDLEDKFQAEAQHYWMTEGCKRYTDVMGDLNESVMVSADQLGLLCKKLDIGLEVYTPDSIKTAQERPEVAAFTHGAQNLPEGEYRWILKVHNAGVHWQYQEPEGRIDQVMFHNQFYPGHFTRSFSKNDNMSGLIKIYGDTTENKTDLIQALVISQLMQINPEFAAKEQARSSKVEKAPLMADENPRPSKRRRTGEHDVAEQALRAEPIALLRAHQPRAAFQKRIKQLPKEQPDLKALHAQAQKNMNILLNNLDRSYRKGKISEDERQLIFEFYYNVFEDEFKKENDINKAKVKKTIREIRNPNISNLRYHAIDLHQTSYEIANSRKRKFMDIVSPLLSPRPSKRPRR